MQQRQPDAPRNDGYWTRVRTWPPPPHQLGIRGEAKLAWHYLFLRAGGVERTIKIRTAFLGADQGTSDRSGWRYLRALAKAGLITMPDKFMGEVVIFLRDPLQVAQARLVPAASDGQGELFPDEPQSPSEDDEDARPGVLALQAGAVTAAEVLARSRGGCDTTSAAEVVSHPPLHPPSYPPTPAPHEGQGEAAQGFAAAAEVVSHPPNSMLKHRSILSELRREEIEALSIEACCSAEVAPPPPTVKFSSETEKRAYARMAAEAARRRAHRPAAQEPPTLGAVLPAALRKLPTPAERRDQAERYAADIFRRVDDPRLLRGPLMRVVWSWSHGLIESETIERVLRRLGELRRRGLLRCQPGAYFVGAMQRAFNDVGVPWKGGGVKEHRDG